MLEYRGEGRFEFTPEAALVFPDVENPASRIGRFVKLPQTIEMMRNAMEAFRTGVGRAYSEQLPDPEELTRDPLQIWSRTALVPDALPRLGNVVERLQQGGRVADIGCGAGAAPMAVARAFPSSTVRGYDNWDGALEVAEGIRQAEGIANISFHNPDEEPLPGEPTFDLVMTMDCLHDMVRPDLLANAIRRAIKPDGAWFIVDMDGAATPEENLPRPNAALMLAVSMFVCLQSSASTDDGLALGTLGLPEPEMRKLVTNAGFSSFERVEGIEHPLNAYYVARP